MSENTDGPAPGLTISCAELVEVVTDYLENQVDDELRTEFEAHLALCPGCDAYLEQMRATIRILGRVPVESLSEQARVDLISAFSTFHAPQQPTDGP